MVCNEGKELFRKDFADGKYKGENTLVVPFDFIALCDATTPRGKFYEMEYTTGGRYGMVCRGLIQAVDPTTDISLIVGALKHKGCLPQDLVPHNAYLRDDIDCVQVCGCSPDEEDGTCTYGPVVSDNNPEISVLDFALGEAMDYPGEISLKFYDNHLATEVSIGSEEKFHCDPILVWGSDNVWDEAFKEQREEDLASLRDSLEDVKELCGKYRLQYLLSVQMCPIGKKKTPCFVDFNCTDEFVDPLFDFLKKKDGKEAAATKV